jgi:glycosyltransferase involved in cell wall biosynthesis
VRILHLHSGNIFGGIESMLATIARHQCRESRVESTFALVFDGRLRAELVRSGATPALLGDVRLARPSTVRRARRNLSDVLASRQPDIVIVHLPWTQAVFGPEIRRGGVRMALWLHGPATGWLHTWTSLTPPDAVICNSAFTRSTMAAPYRRLPCAVVHCPLSPPPPRPGSARGHTRASLSTAPDDVVVLQASRLETWKGHEVHLRALARLANMPGWTAWIAGGAHQSGGRAYEARLHALAAGLGLASRVRFIGDQDDVAGVMAASDVYCQPNTEPEPFGLAFVEGLYAGLAVVGADSGGVREIVTGDCGVLVPPGDVEALAEALRMLVDDRARRERLGASGPARAKMLCDPATQLERLERFLTAVLTRCAA